MILTSVLQAMGLFAATNIDDIIVLSLFFARGAGQRGTTARILAGQYLGFAGILGAAVLVTIGAGAFLPSAAIPYFGLIPLGLGLWAAWQAWRGDDDDDDDEAKVAGKKVGVWTVAGVTLANGGDNIGVYTPVFLSVEPLAVVAYCIVFLALVAVLLVVAQRAVPPPVVAGEAAGYGPPHLLEHLRRLSSERGVTVLFSSHILSDIETLCRRVAALHQGKLVAFGPVEALKSEHRSANMDELYLSLARRAA